MTINIEPMTRQNVAEVYAIERDSFAIPWSFKTFEMELLNPLAIYIAAVDGESGEIIGFAGMHHVLNEGHITNIAVREKNRRQGVGDALIAALFDIAAARNIDGLVLELRVGNVAAHRLYAKHGFTFAGIRKNYYSDTKEDAVVMWKTFKSEVAQ